MQEKNKKKKKRQRLFIITFLTAIILTVSTYAWLSSSLNVKINFFKMSVASNTGLFISLDGVNFSDSIVVSADTVINDLKALYPNHTNQWAGMGLWPVSTNGIKNANSDKFEIFLGNLVRTKETNLDGSVKRLLNTAKRDENSSSLTSYFTAFDIFLKNVSGSPKSDNLYFDTSTFVDYAPDVDSETRAEMNGILNTIRIGLLKINSVSLKSDINTIQNQRCNNSCEMLIYEPFSTKHVESSVESANKYGITLQDGDYYPTYAIIAEGKKLEPSNGHPNTGIPLYSTHFAYQNTIKNFNNVIFTLPNAITKMRIYIWLEGQDIDSLETYSKGAEIDIAINFVKDLAGYE